MYKMSIQIHSLTQQIKQRPQKHWVMWVSLDVNSSLYVPRICHTVLPSRNVGSTLFTFSQVFYFFLSSHWLCIIKMCQSFMQFDQQIFGSTKNIKLSGNRAHSTFPSKSLSHQGFALESTKICMNQTLNIFCDL